MMGGVLLRIKYETTLRFYSPHPSDALSIRSLPAQSLSQSLTLSKYQYRNQNQYRNQYNCHVLCCDIVRQEGTQKGLTSRGKIDTEALFVSIVTCVRCCHPLDCQYQYQHQHEYQYQYEYQYEHQHEHEHQYEYQHSSLPAALELCLPSKVCSDAQ
jgi:hypothetical protein